MKLEEFELKLKEQEEVIAKSKKESCFNLLSTEDRLLKVIESLVHSISFNNNKYNEKFEKLDLKLEQLSEDHNSINRNEETMKEIANQIETKIRNDIERKFDSYLKTEEYYNNYLSIKDEIKEIDSVKL